MKASVEQICNYETNQFCTKLFVNKLAFNSNLTRQEKALPPIHTLPVEDVLKNQVLALNNNSLPISENSNDAEVENAFFVADLGEILRQHIRWKATLPRVEPFYAVKCNPDPMVLRLLAALGTGFDCASKSEIQSILDLGVDPSRIIYANPCKQASFIRYAADKNVKMMTFDNAEELHKIKRYFPQAQLVLRILADDSKSLCQLGLKFGASLDSTAGLLRTAQELGLNMIGVSFHVGSGCFDENAFADAVYRAKCVFDQASELGFNLQLLDVGGGFSHERFGDGITFEKIAAVLGPAIDKYFPPNIRVIAEPGRYYAAPAFTIATHIIARRTVQRDRDETQFVDMEGVLDQIHSEEDQHSYMYYINDGMYGAFNCILFDHQIVHPKVLMKGGVFHFGIDLDEPKYKCSIWGPTCDSIDCVTKNGTLPELSPGDWLYFQEMGAYTICAASQFNGFRKSNVIYTTTEPSVLRTLQ
ncbi:279_t:CDS:2 [Ambispora leptoticha]|uniref:ornithine decarboxylase n=1 Tax=Ambispora leptoticha TaxID=144679 RepID=A0A9N9GQK9_9GLOM|nr:279_t:CDS:2 [Ambispora leptoticha]